MTHVVDIQEQLGKDGELVDQLNLMPAHPAAAAAPDGTSTSDALWIPLSILTHSKLVRKWAAQHAIQAHTSCALLTEASSMNNAYLQWLPRSSNRVHIAIQKHHNRNHVLVCSTLASIKKH
jgi:hypothetical protein